MFCTQKRMVLPIKDAISKESAGNILLWDSLHLHLLAHALLLAHHSLGGVSVHPAQHVGSLPHHVGGHVPVSQHVVVHVPT